MLLTILLPILAIPTTLASEAHLPRWDPPLPTDCPSAHVGRAAIGRRFYYVLFQDPSRDNFTEDALNFFAPNIHVTDNTIGYPLRKEGDFTQKPRGTYATNREDFLEAVFGNYAWPYEGVLNHSTPMTTGVEGNREKPCWIKASYDLEGTVLRNWGGKKKGDHYAVKIHSYMDVADLNPDPEYENHYVGQVTYEIDWSSWDDDSQAE